MSALEYPNLFTPLTIGHVTLRNRIAMMPHAVVFAAGYGSAIDRTIDYHVERAKGGAGLIVMSNFLMPESWLKMGRWGGALETTPFGGLDLANDRSLQPHYRRMIEAIRSHGGHFVSQLNLSGRQLRSPGTTNFGLPLFAPSPIPCPRTAEIPKEMTVADIEEYVETMAQAAANMQEAGAAGVELFAAQGYLLHQFLSPASNKRTDEYGGPLANRMRFLLEGVRAIRKTAGDDFLVGVRMNSGDWVPGGLEVDDAVDIARALRDESVSYLNMSGMTSLNYPGWIADITAPTAQFAPRAGKIREAVGGLPVCVSSRIGTPEDAENVLAEGQADFVGMARALLSDPQFPNKAARGDREGIRICTYSNQACIVGLDRGRGVGCVHNPAVGREAQLGEGTMRPAEKARRVAVVGGGPAGMAAARVAAERGHDVFLFERGPALGGRNLMTASVRSRSGYAEIHRWQSVMLDRVGVKVSLNVEVDDDLLRQGGYDAVIVATGSTPRRDGYTTLQPGRSGIAGADDARVFSAEDVFNRPQSFSGHVLVVEDDPHLAGTAAAEKLVEIGATAAILTPHFHAGADLPVHHAPALYRRLGSLGITVETSVFVTGIGPDTVTCEDRFTGETRAIDHAGPVVLAMGSIANDTLARRLGDEFAALHVVGDALAPRQVDAAILDGERAGWMI